MTRHPTSALTIAAALLLMAADGAQAGDWTVKTSLSETLQANDNVNFIPDSGGWAFGTYSSIDLDILHRSYLHEFALTGTLGYQNWFGDAADLPADRFLPQLRASYLRKGKTTDVTVAASYALEPATTGSNLTLNTKTATGDRQSYSAEVKTDSKLDLTNTLTLDALATRTDYIGASPDQIPFTTLAGTATWVGRRTRTTDFTAAMGSTLYAYEDQANTDTLFSFMRAGFTSRLSPRLTVNAGAGATLLDTYRNQPAGGRDGDARLGLLADARADYALKSLTVSASVAYGNQPDENGDILNSLTFDSALGYKVNDRSDVRLTAEYRRSDGTRGPLSDETFSLSPSYSYEFARDWGLTLAYQFAFTRDDQGLARQNAFFLTLKRDYVLQP